MRKTIKVHSERWIKRHSYKAYDACLISKKGGVGVVWLSGMLQAIAGKKFTVYKVDDSWIWVETW